MKGTRPLTIKSAKKIIQGLDIVNPDEVQAIIAGTFVDAPKEEKTESGYKVLSLEAAEAISNWQNFAILALLGLEGFKGTERNISSRLNVPIGTVMECLDRLETLNLVEKTPTGWKSTGKNLSVPGGVPSAALREGHRQHIQKALDSLELDPVELRDISGITMSVAREKIPEARKAIQNFRRKLSTLMEDGKADAVYRLNIQLFPLSQEKLK